MSEPIYFAPLRVPFVDPETGIISRPWQLLLQGIFNRIGGTSGQSNDDILQGVPNELGAAELLAMLSTAAQDVGQTPPTMPSLAPDDQTPVMIPAAVFDDLLGELRQTREIVAELAKSLQGLQQGTVA